MRSAFFGKTARNNIRKNYRFFIPRILAETGLLGCFYITLTLAKDERIGNMRGGGYVTSFMSFGTVILGLLAIVLMFYANSFLMKQRKREFGLYNVLGMEKRHVARVLFHENLICSLISVAAGIVLGLLMYKLCSLLVCRLLQTMPVLGFYYVKPKQIMLASALFLLLDLCIYFADCIDIARMKPVELLKSDTVGEREPKVKWVLLVFGVLCLGGGYGLALGVKSAVEALLWFFGAVILVILGTYFLFVSGSIFVLKSLRKNKGYYYKKNHFTTVSGLLYRMKQNAVGLASIAILATGVLVMISTTVSLYSSMEDTLANQYPQQVYVSGDYCEGTDETCRPDIGIPAEDMVRITRDAAEKCGLAVTYVEPQRYLEVCFCRDGELLGTDRENGEGIVSSFIFITEAMYRSLGGEELSLSGYEVAVCPISGTAGLNVGRFRLAERNFDIVLQMTRFPMAAHMVSSDSSYGVVVADEAVLRYIYDVQKKAYGKDASEYTDRAAAAFADAEAYEAKDEELRSALLEGMRAYAEEKSGSIAVSASIDTLADTRAYLVGMYGTFLFLGIILGTVCLFATALIVYYKQISEGYEDRERFQIMKKVGMSDAEIRRTIRSQILLVFFLPLLTAGIHMCFAFPMLEKLMYLLMLSGTGTFIRCSVAVYLAFAAVYIVIYSVTARSYYKIIR